MVFKDDITKEILLTKHMESELSADYKSLLNQLLKLGYTVLSVTIDGKRGLQKVFKEFPMQMCHFHQAKTVRRYITKGPRLQAGKDLKKIMYRLTQTNEKNFTKKLDEWYKNFIEEKSINIETEKSYYTYYKVRAAYEVPLEGIEVYEQIYLIFLLEINIKTLRFRTLQILLMEEPFLH